MEKSTATEGVGSSELETAAIIETPPDSLDTSVIFHVVTDVLAFILYMHHQIPSALQDIILEFDELRNEYKDLEDALTGSQIADMKPSIRRQHLSRKREVKHGIRRLEKLMATVAKFKEALWLLITEAPHILRLALVIGPSPLRPLHLYELCLLNRTIASADFTRTKMADGLSRKVIRTLISKGAGSSRDSGPSKLYLLVEAPSSLHLPLHFLPKRDFRYNKKVVPYKLRLKCKSKVMESNAQCDGNQTDSSVVMNSMADDNIWYMCRHTIKGLPSRTISPEE